MRKGRSSMTVDVEHPVGAITDEQRLFYETNGYLVLRDVLQSPEIAALREAADRAESEWRSDPSRPGLRDAGIAQVANIIEYDDLFLTLLNHPAVVPVVRDLMGPDISLMSTDYYLMSGKSESDRGWHRDVSYHGIFHPMSTMLIKVTFVLYDEDLNRAPTALIPGSHKFLDDFKLPHVSNAEDMPGQMRMLLRAGEAWLFNARCYHAALPNRTDDPRRILIYDFGHSWMKPRRDCNPSARLQEMASTAIMQQLLHVHGA